LISWLVASQKKQLKFKLNSENKKDFFIHGVKREFGHRLVVFLLCFPAFHFSFPLLSGLSLTEVETFF